MGPWVAEGAFAPTTRITDNHRPSTWAPVSGPVTLNGEPTQILDLPVRVLCHSAEGSRPPGPVTGRDPQAHSSPSPTHRLPDNGPASATLPSACARPPTQQARINPGPWAQATVLRGDNEPSQWALNPAFPQQCRSPVSSTVTPTAEDINGANAHGWAILAHERALVLVVNGAFSGPCQRRDGRQRGEGAGQV